MTSYAVKFEKFMIGGCEYQLRSLLDRQQYSDPDGVAERLGISSATWPLFGLLWPAGCVLASHMSGTAFAGRRVLEVGCGLGLASLVAHTQLADVVASDVHPLADAFLQANAALNGLTPIPFHRGDWQVADPGLGRFDLIIGSDLLYERMLPAALAEFIELHAAADAEVIVVDPDRGQQGRFTRSMDRHGFGHAVTRVARHDTPGGSFKGCVHTYSRGRVG